MPTDPLSVKCGTAMREIHRCEGIAGHPRQDREHCWKTDTKCYEGHWYCYWHKPSRKLAEVAEAQALRDLEAWARWYLDCTYQEAPQHLHEILARLDAARAARKEKGQNNDC